ncbi:CDC48 family AAA ATPase [Tardisphaera saccharovorans]
MLSQEGEEKREVILRAADAKPRDYGRGKVRINQAALQALGVEVGDVVELFAKRRSAAIAWPAYIEDQDQDIIRMDGLTRQNIGASLGDRVVVRKASYKPAQMVKLASSSFQVSVDEGFSSYVKKRLIDFVVVQGDKVLIPVLGQSMVFTVVSVRPPGIVLVTDDTQVVISDKPVEGDEGRPITYDDIGGLKDVILKVREMIELPLKHPELFRRLGIDPPKGVLLIGPPGVGKTLLAKAVASETDAYFVSINGPEIMSKFYGESEQRLREIFDGAKKHAPSIIFIDEIDAIAPKREEVTGEVERRVVAQLLALMDGLQARGDVVVIGASNIPQAIDPALRRPGRFDREIEIGIPNKEGREEILQIHTRGMPLAKDVDIRKLVDMTNGYTGADLAALVREAAMRALRRYLPEIQDIEGEIPAEILEKMEVTMDDFMKALPDIVPTTLREVYVEVPEVRWDDVGGLSDVKETLKEAVQWPLEKPEVFKRVGIRPPKGVLLYGPPGVGKTLLAKAVATESEANFISIKGPEIYSKWVGESERAIRSIFRKARQSAPCVVFLDEVEAIAPMRGLSYGDSRVSENVISQLLTELDGMESLENIVVIAATNRPDMLDPALLRPGRLDLLVYIPPPDVKSRKEILKIHTSKMPLSPDVSLDELAIRTEGYSGADLEELVREAGMAALKRDIDAKEVTLADFERALSSVRPSITEDMIKFYQQWNEKAKSLRRVEKQELLGWI